jgi:adenylate cyclase
MSEPELNYARSLGDALQDKPEYQLLRSSLKSLEASLDNDKQFAKTLLDKNVIHESQIQNGSLPKAIKPKNNEYLQLQALPFAHFSGYNGSLELFIRTATPAGFVTHIPDKDGAIRHSMLLAKNQKNYYPSLALQTAMNYLLEEEITVLTHKQRIYGFKMGEHFIPTNSKGEVLIPFWGKAGTLEYISATDILNKKLKPDALEGSIALIGSTMPLLADLHQTPIGQLFPGVEIIGNSIQGIIDQLLAT